MAKLYIPRLGDELVLTKDWTFRLFYEHRNIPLIAFLKIASKYPQEYYARQKHAEMITLPAGSLLIVRRIFIRLGSRDFDSITFSYKAQGKKSVRFWAKLDDVNAIEFAEHAPDSVSQNNIIH